MQIDVVLITNLRSETDLQNCLIALKNADRGTHVLSFHVGLTSSSSTHQAKLQEILARLDPRGPTENSIPLTVRHLSSQLHPGAARNRLAHSSMAQWILFVDDDVQVQGDLFLEFSKCLANIPDAAVVGGPNLTPAESSWFQQASGSFFENPFLCGPFSKRYSARGSTCAGHEHNLILCGLFVRRREFQKILFPENFICAEENRLLVDLENAGVRLLWSPKLVFFHTRRSDLWSFARQLHKYGRGRAQLFWSAPRQTATTSAFALGALGYLLGIAAWPTATLIATLILMLFATLWGLFQRQSWRMIATWPVFFIVALTAYSAGIVIETKRWLLQNLRPWKSIKKRRGF